MIKAVLFDFGGVLTEGGKSGGIERTMGRLYGISPKDVNMTDLHEKLRRGQMLDEDFFNELNRRHGRGSVTVTEAIFHAEADVFVRSKPVYALAERLRKSGIKTGILSNFYKMGAIELEKRGFYEGFAPVVLSCDECMVKPEEQFYQIAVDRLGVAPDEIIFIDDQPKCLPPAERMGMFTVKADSPEQIVADVTKIIKEQNGLDL